MNTPHFPNREFPIPRAVEGVARKLYALSNDHCTRTDASLYRALQYYDRLMEMESAADPQFIAQVRRSRISCYLRLSASSSFFLLLPSGVLPAVLICAETFFFIDLIDEIDREMDYMFTNPVVPLITATSTSTTSPPAQKWRSNLRRFASLISARSRA
ncbi:hypothetical protein D9615_007112 [Tricholomella constricta]|uniref:Uncharacterized protein n=1 Tax=Tricholomella constricta TaxID=117010 RepID=A0A8H5H823_9AGAR|nr:hypothetical protein D9615_007112 [Tricholomella constricta]